MESSKKVEYISSWIKNYVDQMPTKAQSLVIGISGGIDSSVSSTLCAMTGLKTIVLTMPIKQRENQHERENIGPLHVSGILGENSELEGMIRK